MKIKIKGMTADLITHYLNKGWFSGAKELASLAPTLITTDHITALLNKGRFNSAKEMASLSGLDISDLEIDI